MSENSAWPGALRRIMPAMTRIAPQPVKLQSEACYRALQARDARFDGRFFTGVTSTGIYCRPVCKVRTPKRENCLFFEYAAQAEGAGFRPCLRCRPELAPGLVRWSVQDASATLAWQAQRLLDDAHARSGNALSGACVSQVAARLGISERHLRRIFQAQWGISPLQYLQTRRLLTAKQLLTDTGLPIAQVAQASGWASARRLQAALAQGYGLSPTQLRRAGTAAPTVTATATALRLAYRPPYDAQAMLCFLQQRQLLGVEHVAPDARQPELARTLRIDEGTRSWRGWIRARFDLMHDQVLLQVSEGLHPALPQVLQRVRSWLDLDADPLAINAVLHTSFPQGDGLRVPGCMDGFELAVRAILGQQITVAAARTLAQRLVQRFGEPLATPYPELTHLFPSAATLARADGASLGALGIVRQRQAAIVALAQAVLSAQLQLHSSADVPRTLSQLQALPGIGAWTAQYIAMRALRWPDAFPAADVALHKTLGVQHLPHPARTAQAASQAWRPWRSYAVVRSWAGMAATTATRSH